MSAEVKSENNVKQYQWDTELQNAITELKKAPMLLKFPVYSKKKLI